MNSKLILFCALKKSSNMIVKMLAIIRNVDITLVAKINLLILEVGELLVQKHRESNSSDTSQTMRKVSRLVIQLRKIVVDPLAQLSTT